MVQRCDRGTAIAKRTKTADDPAGPSLAPVRTRVIYCGDNLEQLQKLPDRSVDLITIDRAVAGLRPSHSADRRSPSGRGDRRSAYRRGRETRAERGKRAFQDRHESTQATIEFMRPRSVELARVLKKTGSFYYHCDWHASDPAAACFGRGNIPVEGTR